MKKVRKIIFILIIMIITKINVNAATGNVSLKCPTTVVIGEAISCNVVGTASGLIDGLETNISFTDGITYDSISSSYFSAEYANNKALAILNVNGMQSGNIIMTIKFKTTSIGNKTINLSDIKMPVEENENIAKVKPGNVSATINVVEKPKVNPNNQTPTKEKEAKPNNQEVIKENINTLKSLIIENQTLTPNFDSDITEYNLTTDINTIKIEATLTSEKSKFVDEYGPREVKLENGTNEVLIKVEAENEEIKTYKINVLYEEKTNLVSEEDVVKEENTKKKSPIILVIGATIIIIILIFIVYGIKKSINKKNNY